MEDGSIASFLEDIMQRRNVTMSQMATDLGLNHSTVSRWISGKYMPSTRSYRKLAEYSGVPLSKILSLASDMLPIDKQESAQWPEFKDYLRQKYPDVLNEDLIDMMEDMIEWQRRRHHRRKAS